MDWPSESGGLREPFANFPRYCCEKSRRYAWVVATYLDRILVAHRAQVAGRSADLGELRRQVEALDPCRSFRAAVAAPGLSLIAEIKRRSPSKGDLAPELDPSKLAGIYEQAGAAALSVLTDEEFFGGSFDDLRAARLATALPVLRKDFTVSALDVLEARLGGADALLLIVAALDDSELAEFLALAREIGLDVLVEVHDEVEVERALRAGADLIGVNQRDLVTFEVDGDRALRVHSSIPATVLSVAESGVRDGADARRRADAGFDAVLVGEHLVTADNVADAVRSMVGHEVGSQGARTK